MEIDWFTFLAQVVNFLILLLLLKRFLYRPVMEAVRRRQERIESRLAEAREERTEAERLVAEAREQEERIERERRERLQAMRAEVRKTREELMEELREEADEARERWRQTLRQERESFLAELRERTSEGLHDGVRRALADLADEGLERRAIQVFLDRLESMEEVDREAFADGVSRSGGHVTATSRHELPDEWRRRIRESTERLVGRDVTLRFETDPDVLWGVELRTADQKLGWSAANYLSSLEEDVGELLEAEYEQAAPGAAPALPEVRER